MAIISEVFIVDRVGASKANVRAGVAVPTAIAPNACTVIIQAVDSYRQVEIDTAVVQLRDYMIENDFTEEITAAELSMPIGGGKGSIEAGQSTEDGYIILQYSDESGNAFGTEIFTAMVEYIRMYMRDNYLKLL